MSPGEAEEVQRTDFPEPVDVVQDEGRRRLELEMGGGPLEKDRDLILEAFLVVA